MLRLCCHGPKPNCIFHRKSGSIMEPCQDGDCNPGDGDGSWSTGTKFLVLVLFNPAWVLSDAHVSTCVERCRALQAKADNPAKQVVARQRTTAVTLTRVNIVLEESSQVVCRVSVWVVSWLSSQRLTSITNLVFFGKTRLSGVLGVSHLNDYSK